MNLAIDIGNTRTKLAVFDGENVLHKAVWENLAIPPLYELTYNQKVEKVILCSVATVPEEVEEWLMQHFFYLQLSTETPLPIQVKYKTPKTLGKDRIAAAAGAYHLFPGQNCLVVDAGTCITLDILNAKGEFLGGNISPGIEMRLKAMHHFTKRLPLISKNQEATPPIPNTGDIPPPFLGDNTENAMRNGGVYGAVWEMEGFIRLCRKYFRPLRVILTGGDADFFAKNIKTKIFAHPNLVLAGLNKILQYNVEISKG
jgi:type III pantothenate kinase